MARTISTKMKILTRKQLLREKLCATPRLKRSSSAPVRRKKCKKKTIAACPLKRKKKYKKIIIFKKGPKDTNYQGVQGPPGPQGMQGLGTQGIQGPLGEQGEQGEQGIQGAPGIQGSQGPRGSTGAVTIPDIIILPTAQRYFYMMSSDAQSQVTIPADAFTNDEGAIVTEFSDIGQNSYSNLYINGILQEGSIYQLTENAVSIHFNNQTLFSGTPIIIEIVSFSAKTFVSYV
ncbi:DUF4183 domain-containing protein [Paenibacillus sp. PL91]|uniref:DUF4183 domain-containing protein n=1 Tax=Paenibacillus sp. PL91 TaxID=2729538 RepID=UPI00145FABDC|nr:DUF4183 domain-containing protein [Paenibacillus sp. PL91]MBC9198785.1 DUF4183 domain-containing protein [Paenibacillus sp. PL91]